MMDFGDDTDMPYLTIIEQPKEKGYRYRYKSEGATHGGILGQSSEGERKTYPAVEIKNYKGNATIIAQLVSDDSQPKLHPHCLTGKHCENGVCRMRCGPSDMIATFPNLGIERVTKKQAEPILVERYLNSEAQQLNIEKKYLPQETVNSIKYKAKKEAENVNLTSVRIMFVAYLHKDTGDEILPAVISDVILDCKATNLCPLKISRISKSSGSVSGNEEIWILCEKVQKDDIRIRFTKEENGQETFGAYGEFFPSDVHKQVAIVFKSPPYKDMDIRRPVQVKIQLQRRSDGELSAPKTFTYKPIEDQEQPAIVGKAFSQGMFNTKPKKKPFNAPNPQKMPIDPTKLMNQSNKRRRVEPNQQYTATPFVNTTAEMDNFGSNFGTIDALELLDLTPMDSNQNMMSMSSYQIPNYQAVVNVNTTQSAPVPSTSASGHPQSDGFISLSRSQEVIQQRNQQNNPSNADNNLFGDLYIQTDSIQADSVPNLKPSDAKTDDEDEDFGAITIPKMTTASNIQDKVSNLQIHGDAVGSTQALKEEKKRMIEGYITELCTNQSREQLFQTMEKTKQSLMHKAVGSGNKQLVERMLKDGLMGLMVQDSKGFTPLHNACFNNQSDILNIMLQYWDKAMMQDDEGNFPIHIATVCGSKECIAQLDRYGYSVNERHGRTGKSPLHMAVETKNLEMAKFLIEDCSANLEECDDNGYTPLHIAVASNNINMAEYLLNRGANKYAECSEVKDPSKPAGEGYGLTPDDFACTTEMKNLFTVSEEEQPPLIIDVEDDSIELMDPLVRHKFCSLLNKSEADRIKLAKSCQVDTATMKTEKNQTEFILSNYKGTLQTLKDILESLGLMKSLNILNEA